MKIKNLNNFLPFLLLAFLIFILGLSTYKISTKQEDNQQITKKDFEQNPDSEFIKEKIILAEFSLPDLFNENKNFSKKDLLGKYSLINLFASWCTTCQAEHQILMRLKNEKIIEVYGIAWRDINQNTKDFLAKNGNPFTKVAKDNQALFTKLINVRAVPETLLINRQGDVIWRRIGNLEEQDIYQIKSFLQNSS
ncbi:MAG: redoxin family protein [Rickettsiales bacterium]|nr:redoxin family protein [Rickettsiales bacterium]